MLLVVVVYVITVNCSLNQISCFVGYVLVPADSRLFEDVLAWLGENSCQTAGVGESLNLLSL